MIEEGLVKLVWDNTKPQDELLSKEWLVTNGLGGYASGTLMGVSTRRYHGLFTPNMPSPKGRTVFIPQLEEEMSCESEKIMISSGENSDGTIDSKTAALLKEFRLEWLIPVWTFEWKGRIFEKRILMPYRQNTVYVEYRLLQGDPLQVSLRPFFAFRGHDEPMSQDKIWPFHLLIKQGKHEIHPLLEMGMDIKIGVKPQGFLVADSHAKEFFYRADKSRGLDSEETLFSPGYFSTILRLESPIVFFASIEAWESLQFPFEKTLESEIRRLQHLTTLTQSKTKIEAHLTLAADAFIALPGNRTEENVLIHAAGEHVRTIIAGYHWFTDWGRDTMISLEGLCLCTGRYDQAKAILRTFANYIHNGLLPNHFPEGQNQAIYNTVDATFWYFHALDRYFEYTQDSETLHSLYPLLKEVIYQHIKGTSFGIKVDETDGLIHAGMEGYALTWMDAKVEDWVVTPRRGKPVEIQALWYNALCLMRNWASEWDQEAVPFFENLAEKVKDSFDKRFWYENGGYLYDIVDGEKGDDTRLRPNQIFSFSLRHPILKENRAEQMLKTVHEKLMTPYGLRTLDPAHPDYKPHYEGSRRARDGAYHQGLVWPWLTGHFMNAWWRVHHNLDPFDVFFKAMESHLEEAGIGSISEIFDSEPPFIPRACIAQAWSVAELLRMLRTRSILLQEEPKVVSS